MTNFLCAIFCAGLDFLNLFAQALALETCGPQPSERAAVKSFASQCRIRESKFAKRSLCCGGIRPLRTILTRELSPTSAMLHSALVVVMLAAPILRAQVSSGGSSVTLPGTQSPFLGSEPEGNATTEVLQIDFKEAIDRGLRNNLGQLLASDQTLNARGERWKELSNLLPNVSAAVTEDVQTLSLTAL